MIGAQLTTLLVSFPNLSPVKFRGPYSYVKAEIPSPAGGSNTIEEDLNRGDRSHNSPPGGRKSDLKYADIPYNHVPQHTTPTSSLLADAPKPQYGDDINLAFLDLHNYGSFGGHHNMGAPLYGNSGSGVVGYTMERQGQAQALDLAANPLTNGYQPPTNATTNQSQSRTIDPMLTQQFPVPPQVTPVPSNGATTNTNVIPNFGSTRPVSQPPPLPPLPPLHEQMVGVKRTSPGRSVSVQSRGLGLHSHSSFPSYHSHSRGLSVTASPHDMMLQKSMEVERGRKRASWGSGMVG